MTPIRHLTENPAGVIAVFCGVVRIVVIDSVTDNEGQGLARQYLKFASNRTKTA